MTLEAAVAGAVFVATFVVMALGRVHRVAVARGTAALVGGALTFVLLAPAHAVDWRAWRLVDWQVIGILAGLMVLAALAETAGLFAGVRRRLARLHPALALWICLGILEVASALLLNDAAVVVLVPFLLPVLRNHGLPLVPCVTLMAVAANLGSLLTPFGNPQDVVLATAAHLRLVDFLRVQGPIVAVGTGLLGVACVVLARSCTPVKSEVVHHTTPRARPWLAACIGGFLVFALQEPGQLGVGATAAALVALLGLLPALRTKALRAAWDGLDWNVLALFVGLYLLTAGLPTWFPAARFPLAGLDTPASALVGTALLSNSIGNVPAILTFQRLDPVWTIAHAPFLVAVSTLGGALLLTGSAASLLAADVARRQGVEVRFLPFLRHAALWVLPMLALAAWATW